MNARLLHIYRNTPFGRETFLQSIYFCKTLDVGLSVYQPRLKKCLMYFEHSAVQLDLDDSYLRQPATARERIETLTAQAGLQPEYLDNTAETASSLADIPTDFEFMTCPRIISDMSSKIGLGKIGSKVRSVLYTAQFPVLIPCATFKPWQSIAVLFGGSDNAVKAIRLGLHASARSGLPLQVFTQAQQEPDYYTGVLEKNGLLQRKREQNFSWVLYEEGQFADNLYDIPHDALVVLGAVGQGVIKDIMFGSTMELVQTTLPNSLLVVGPKFGRHPWSEEEAA